MSTTTIDLKEQYENIKAQNPKMRIRNIAEEMNVSEAQLLALHTGENVTALQPTFPEILNEVITMGQVMALTRNDAVVHERKGIYNNMSFHGPMGLAVNPDIDLRLFMMHWKYGFAVTEGDRKSLQFFDKSGTAIHKIYLTKESNEAAYETLVSKFKSEEQTTELAIQAYPPAVAELPDTDIDIAAFREGWSTLKDTHDFFGLTQKHKVTRTQALRLAPEGFVQQISNDSARKALMLAAERQVPIMVFVGNKGCIQIHSGEVTNLMEAGPWYNVIDPMFNLHLNETAIDTSFIVKKPSNDGIITSLEIFDKSGELIVQFFGKRKPGIPELEEWRTLVNDIAAAQ